MTDQDSIQVLGPGESPIGSGSLVHPFLVLVHRDLAARIDSDHPEQYGLRFLSGDESVDRRVDGVHEPAAEGLTLLSFRRRVPMSPVALPKPAEPGAAGLAQALRLHLDGGASPGPLGGDDDTDISVCTLIHNRAWFCVGPGPHGGDSADR